MLIDLMNGSGGGLSCTHILNAKSDNIHRAIISVMYQVNTMKYVATRSYKPKPLFQNYIH